MKKLLYFIAFMTCLIILPISLKASNFTCTYTHDDGTEVMIRHKSPNEIKPEINFNGTNKTATFKDIKSADFVQDDCTLGCPKVSIAIEESNVDGTNAKIYAYVVKLDPNGKTGTIRISSQDNQEAEIANCKADSKTDSTPVPEVDKTTNASKTTTDDNNTTTDASTSEKKETKAETVTKSTTESTTTTTGDITTIGKNDFCDNFSMLWTIVGYAIFAIKVVVPIILIVSGMITLAQAVADGSDDKKKNAQKGLFAKIGYAVAVFLVIQIVSIIIGLVSSGKSYEECAHCAFHPFDSSAKCGVQKSEF